MKEYKVKKCKKKKYISKSYLKTVLRKELINIQFGFFIYKVNNKLESHEKKRKRKQVGRVRIAFLNNKNNRHSVAFLTLVNHQL